MANSSFVYDIKNYADSLKLGVLKSDIEDALDNALNNNLTHEEFLYRLLQKEHDIRKYNLTQSRIRLASLPYKNKYKIQINILH